MIRTIRLAALIGATLVGTGLTAAPSFAQDRFDYHGGGRDDRRDYQLTGPGVRFLLPELRDTPRGRAFVLRNFDRDGDSFISPGEADAANHAFVAEAGPNRDRFDWDARDRMGPPDRDGYRGQDQGRYRGGPDRGGPDRGGPDRVVVVEEEVAPLPPAFRAFHPRQTHYGATIDFGDVLFATDRADLRPTARDRLAALAGFLRNHPRIRIRIDGYTDSRASVAHNQALSEARANSVASAMADLGVDQGRIQTAGHGESDPVATNATAAGRQRNRRVEVTLVGQRADRFER